MLVRFPRRPAGVANQVSHYPSSFCFYLHENNLGSYSTQTATALCPPCAAGKFSAEYASTTCNDCPGGVTTSERHIPNIIASDPQPSAECLPCQQGKFHPITGLTACLSCPNGDEHGQRLANSLIRQVSTTPHPMTIVHHANPASIQTWRAQRHAWLVGQVKRRGGKGHGPREGAMVMHAQDRTRGFLMLSIVRCVRPVSTMLSSGQSIALLAQLG